LLGCLAGAARGDEAFFERKIRPVLAGACFRCHGGDRVAGKLRVDSRAALLKGGASGPAIDPAAPERSLIVRALRHADGVAAMPPGKRLPETVARDFVAWVRGGAAWPGAAPPGFRAGRHWAFRPLRVVDPPADPGRRWASPVDRFLAARQRARRLRPAGPADRRTLIRRVTFDLVGLPPDPEQVRAFVQDTHPDAYERVVDRLLASPAYGEKWGRHWLDLVRYADTAGETADFPVPDAWRYRDWVVRALNADLPYDRFVTEQLAGDLLAAAEPEDSPRRADLVVATGYLAVSRRFGFDSVQDHYLTLEDAIDVLGKSLLGLTVGCARCHDHKYDPISSEDYYALYGILDSTRFPFAGCEKDRTPRDLVPLVPAGQIARDLRALDAEVRRTEAEFRKAEARTRVRGAGGAAELPGARSAWERARKKRHDYPASVPTAYAVAEGKPHDARLHKRGDPHTLGKEVPRRFLEILGGQRPTGAGSGRLDLARWVVDPHNPLTARVMVNRLWQHHFGAGLVRTPSDFGTRGSPPSHPELLDYLAARFIRGGWSVKALHRLIVCSEAYRRGSRAGEDVTTLDPGNVYLARFARRRLGAEEIRDAMLYASGDLDRSPAGPHPFPPARAWGFTQHAPFQAVYDHDRRSLYLMTQRIKRHPFLGLFDGADASSSTPGRYTTTVPTQALFFLNDPFLHARAASLAARTASLPDRDRQERLAQVLFGRGATEAEHALSARFRAGYAAGLKGGYAAGRGRRAWEAWARVLLSSNEFLYVD
jgi:hypothetical protein